MINGADEYLKAIYQADTYSDSVLAFRLSAEGVESCPESAELWAVRAHHLCWMKRWEESESAAAKARELGPDSALVWAAQSSIHVFYGRTSEAASAADRAMALDGDNPWALAYCIDVYHTLGNQRKAVDLADRWCGRCPDDALAYARRAMIVLGSGRKDDAERLLEEALQRFPDSAALIRQQALMTMREDLPEAIRLYKRAVELSPGSFMAWGQYASALAFTGNNDEAETAALKAIEMCPCAKNAMEVMSRICLSRGRQREAEEWHKRAAESIPGIAIQSQLAPASTAMRNGRWQQVLTYTEPLLSAATPSVRNPALAFRAQALVELRRPQEAEQIIYELEQTGFDSPDVYDLRGRIMLAKRDHDAAESIFRTGIRKYPTEGPLRAHLLKLLHARKKLDEEKALVLDITSHPPESPWGLGRVIMALFETGHKAEGRQMRLLGQTMFPDAKDFRYFEVVEKIENGNWIGGLSMFFKMYVLRR